MTRFLSEGGNVDMLEKKVRIEETSGETPIENKAEEMKSERRTCQCGATHFKKLKMGGDGFTLQWESKMNFWRGSGFQPDMWACRTCGEISFTVPAEQSEELDNE